MDQYVELLKIWRNPIAIRFARSRLRLRKAIFWLLLTLIITTFVTMLTYLIGVNTGRPSEAAARNLLLPLIIIQGLILMVKGTGAVSAGLIQDKIDETLDYQRLTPLTPIQCVVGYLFGLPVLEYVMFALTLPHLLFVVAVGNVPLATIGIVYFAFFVCVTLYHMTGIAVGIVLRRWLLGYAISIVTVLLVNVILPTFISQIGLKFVQYLSVWPVISQKLVPLIVGPERLAFVQAQNPWLSLAGDVPFYNWEFSPLTFTLTLQGALILTFALMALRRWRSSTMHSLSKPYALAFLAGFIFIVMGNVWPIITRQGLPFPLFGVGNLEQVSEAVALSLPVVYSLVIWALVGTLLAIVIPSHHAYVRGLRRALKQGQQSPRAWDDDSANLAFTGLFVVVAMAGFGVLYGQIIQADFFEFREGTVGLWRLPLAFGLVLTYTLLLLQVAQLRLTVLVILLGWFVPILVAIILGAAFQTVAEPHVVIASFSPLAFLAMAGATPAIGLVPADAPAEFDLVLTGVTSGILFSVLQIGWLLRRWLHLRRKFDADCRAGVAPAEKEPRAPSTLLTDAGL